MRIQATPTLELMPDPSVSPSIPDRYRLKRGIIELTAGDERVAVLMLVPASLDEDRLKLLILRLACVINEAELEL